MPKPILREGVYEKLHSRIAGGPLAPGTGIDEVTLAGRGWAGAGIGAGAGTAAGIATALLTRGREVELRQGSTLDVVFDRAAPLE